jgi:hypothetical protein
LDDSFRRSLRNAATRTSTQRQDQKSTLRRSRSILTGFLRNAGGGDVNR